MKIEIMIAVLALLCIGSLAAAFVLWAKLDEQKQKTKDEHANYIAALNLHNATAEAAQAVQKEFEDYKYFNDDYHIGILHKQIRSEFDRANALQDRLSALLCPMNDHVWKDGVCVKCGRMQDG